MKNPLIISGSGFVFCDMVRNGSRYEPLFPSTANTFPENGYCNRAEMR